MNIKIKLNISDCKPLENGGYWVTGLYLGGTLGFKSLQSLPLDKEVDCKINLVQEEISKAGRNGNYSYPVFRICSVAPLL